MTNKGGDKLDAGFVELLQDRALERNTFVVHAPCIFQPPEVLDAVFNLEGDVFTSTPAGHALRSEVGSTHVVSAYLGAIRYLELITRPRFLEGLSEHRADVLEGPWRPGVG